MIHISGMSIHSEIHFAQLLCMSEILFFYQSPYSDIDECSSNSNGCQMSCINTIGSFNCSCESGYKLIDDGLHCQGIALYTYTKPAIKRSEFSKENILTELDIRKLLLDTDQYWAKLYIGLAFYSVQDKFIAQSVV